MGTSAGLGEALQREDWQVSERGCRLLVKVGRSHMVAGGLREKKGGRGIQKVPREIPLFPLLLLLLLLPLFSSGD